MLHLFAALAEKERAMISRRTKDALAAAKARGVRLGGYRAQSHESQRRAAAHAEQLRSIFEELSGQSARAAASELNRRGIPTGAGGKWHAMQVIRVRERL
jgi:DNA invertase Pin-like site-specific DNA recombinase